MRKILLSLALCYFSLFLFGQSGKVDSVSKLIALHLEDDTTRVNLLNELSQQNIGVNYYLAREHAEKAMRLAEKLHYARGIADSNNKLATSLWSLGENDLAIKYALRAVQIIEKEHLGNQILAESYRALGFAYMEMRELEKAEFYFNAAGNICLQNKNWMLQSKIYIGKAILKYFRNQQDSANFFEKKSHEILEAHHDSFTTALLKYFKASGNDDPQLAIADLTETLNYAKAAGNKYVETMSLMMLGVNYNKEEKYNKAEKYFLHALQMSRTIGIKNLTSQNYSMLEIIKRKQGKFEDAMAYQKSLYELKDSIFNGRRTRQVIELETQYEKEKQEQEIKLLVQQKRADSILKYSLVIGLAIVILSSILIYRLQQSKATKTKELLSLQKSINDRLKETDTFKSRFFANISHEFRTPLTLILAPIEEKLSSSNLPSREKESLQLVKRNANRLLSLVNQLLDLSKLEINKMELVVTQGDLKEFLSIVAASFDSLAENKKIHFGKDIHLGTAEFWYDADKLEKIINNLLFNAFKFTPEGGDVAFLVSQLNQTNDLQMQVIDTGKGIPEEEQQNVFSPFYQSRFAADEGQVGTGLGLSLVKELVQLYRGSVELVSAVDHGSTITVTLPIAKEKLPLHAVYKNENDVSKNKVAEFPKSVQQETSNQDEEFEPEEEATDHDSILIVEDNADLRNFISSILNDQFTILVAKDGEEGYALALEQIPDLIVSDVMMPKMDGISLTEKIKSDDRTSHIPVVLLTAKADVESRIEGLQTGADDYLAKPFSTEELRARVINLIEQRKKLAQKYRTDIPTQSEPNKEISMDEKFLLKARQIVNDNIGDSRFGVEQMASEINLSRTQLFRKLKAISGLSPNEFINEIRLQKAAELILAKVDTLTQISYSVGFNEQSYFAKRFRKKFGVAPGEYIEKSMERED